MNSCEFRNRIKWLVLAAAVSTAGSQAVFDGGYSTSANCAYIKAGSFGSNTHTDNVKYDDCLNGGTISAELVGMDKYVLPQLFFGPIPIAPGESPCDISTYLVPSNVQGRVAFGTGLWKVVCFLSPKNDVLAGKVAANLPGNQGLGTNHMKVLEDMGALAFLIMVVETGIPLTVVHQEPFKNLWSESYHRLGEAYVYDIPEVQIQPQFALIAGPIIVPVMLGALNYNVTITANGLSGLEDKYPVFLIFSSTAYRISYYAIAFPLSLIMTLWSVFLLVKKRNMWLSLFYWALLLEGVIANVLRMVRIALYTPHLQLPAGPDELAFWELFPSIVKCWFALRWDFVCAAWPPPAQNTCLLLSVCRRDRYIHPQHDLHDQGDGCLVSMQ
jgi:hypothetical protein